MKKGRFYALLLGMALFMIILMPCSASASASQTLLPLQSGTIDEGEYIELDFTVPVESTLTISFVGYESGIGTYGDCFFWLQDNAGDIFWNAHDYISYDDRTFTTEVPKGNYKLGMRCEDWEFDYYVTVTGTPKQAVPVTSLKLNATKGKMTVGKTKQLTASYQPYYTTNSLTWSSSNKKVATVSSTGLVTAKSLGTATITAKMGNKTAKCTIVVNAAELVLPKGQSKSLKSMTKNISGLKKSTYKSSKSAVATISTAGKLKAKKNGTTKITVKDKKKNTYTITVKVKNPVTTSVSYVSDTSIYNEVGIKFKNNTGKNITYMTLNITQYDNRGVKLRSPYSYYYVNDTLLANSSKVWEFWVNDDTKKVGVKLTKVWFSDGSTWTP